MNTKRTGAKYGTEFPRRAIEEGIGGRKLMYLRIAVLIAVASSLTLTSAAQNPKVSESVKPCLLVRPTEGFNGASAFAFTPGDLLLFDPQQLHGNLPFEGERLSAIFYCERRIADCGDCGK